MSSQVVFARSIYSAESVDVAVEAFGKLGTFRVDVSADNITVDITKIASKFKNSLIDEFCNHALYETIALRRGK